MGKGKGNPWPLFCCPLNRGPECSSTGGAQAPAVGQRLPRLEPAHLSTYSQFPPSPVGLSQTDKRIGDGQGATRGGTFPQKPHFSLKCLPWIAMGVFADSEMHKTKICIEKASKKPSSTSTVATSCSFLLWWEKKRGLYFVSGGQICSTSLKKTFSSPAAQPSWHSFGVTGRWAMVSPSSRGPASMVTKPTGIPASARPTRRARRTCGPEGATQLPRSPSPEGKPEFRA